MTITLPFLLMILHFSQIFFTEGLTFIVLYLSFQALFFPPGNTSLGQVVDRDLNGDCIARKNSYIVHTKLTRDVCGHNVAVRELDLEDGIRQCLEHYTVFKFDQIVLWQNNPSSTKFQKLFSSART